MKYKNIIFIINVFFSTSIYASLMQQPIQASSAIVPPNIVFTMDDSGSMAFECLPDDLCTSGSRYVGTVPSNQSGSWKNAVAADVDFCISKNSKGDCTSWRKAILGKKLRSPDINPLYYDPQKIYKPWLKEDGISRFPDANPYAAKIFPEDSNNNSVINLVQSSQIETRWCYANVTDCYNSGESSKQSYKISHYYKFNKNSTGANRYDDPVNYTRVDITDAAELVNFANWYVYHRDRMRVAIAGTAEAFSSVPSEYRVGYARINKSVGSSIDGNSTHTIERGVRAFDGVDKKSFYDWLFVQYPKSGGTPLRRAMDAVGKYYARSDNSGPWAKSPGYSDATPHLSCRRSFHILMTDGYWNSDAADSTGAKSNVDNSTGSSILGVDGRSYSYQPVAPYKDSYSNTLADVAMYYWNRDLRPDLVNNIKANNANPAFWQHMVNYGIAFGVSGVLNYPGDLDRLTTGSLTWPEPGNDRVANIDDLWHATVNSRGKFLSARNADEYASSIQTILNDIAAVNGSEAGVGVSARMLSTSVDNKKFEAEFNSENWSGDLKSIVLKSDGSNGEEIWSAAANLPSHNLRKIKIYDPAAVASRPANDREGVAVDFFWNQMSLETRNRLTGGTVDGLSLVNYLRGDRVNEGVNGYRQRDAKSLIGDVVNSTPIWVKDLLNSQYSFLHANIPGKASYFRYLESKKHRVGQVFVGANDGMLHGFYEDDGVESFAYIPDRVLDKVKLLASDRYAHQYLVDGPLIEADVYDASALKWRNLVVGTAGAGAKSIFAINIPVASFPSSQSVPVPLSKENSAPTSKDVLWNISDLSTDSGNHFRDDLGHVLSRVETGVMLDGTWVVILGNGYESVSKRAKLFIVNAINGDLIKVIDTGIGNASTPNGLGGVKIVRDNYQRIVAAYAGDLLGNLWKFDFSSSSSTEWKVAFGGQPLYKAPNNEPIFAAPEYVHHPVEGVMVIFGTGKAFEAGDMQETTQKALYGIWDKVAVGRVSSDARLAIVNQTGIVSQSLTANPLANTSGTFYGLSVTPLNYARDRGWRLPLTIASGQRMVDAPEVIGGLVFMQTMSPNDVVDSCSAASVLRHGFLLDPFMNSITQNRFDTNGNGLFDAADALTASTVELSGSGPATVVREQGKNRYHLIQARTNTKENPPGQGLAGNIKRNWRLLLNVGN